MDAPSESNSLTATALFVASIIVDSFTAHTVDGEDMQAPTSLRTSAVVLTACLASPPIRRWMMFEQRVVVGMALIAVAIGGAHVGAPEQRMADAIFVATALGGIVYTFASGGTERGSNGQPSTSRSKGAEPYIKREALINLALAALAYSSLRLIRLGFDHPLAVRNYSHSAFAYDGTVRRLQGYAYASSTSVVALSAAGAAGLATAAALLVDGEMRTSRCSIC